MDQIQKRKKWGNHVFFSKWSYRTGYDPVNSQKAYWCLFIPSYPTLSTYFKCIYALPVAADCPHHRRRGWPGQSPPVYWIHTGGIGGPGPRCTQICTDLWVWFPLWIPNTICFKEMLTIRRHFPQQTKITQNEDLKKFYCKCLPTLNVESCT